MVTSFDLRSFLVIMANQVSRHYDIVINGGGIVGFTLLNSIFKSPHLRRLKVLLIEQAAQPNSSQQPPRICTPNDGGKHFSNRVSSITPTSRIAFEKLGVWDRVREFSKDVKSIKVWNYDYTHKIIFEDDGPMFSVIENNRLSLALLDNLHDEGCFDSIGWNHELDKFEKQPSGSLHVTAKNIENGEEMSVSTSLLLGCDGFNSKVRQLAGMNYHEMDLDKNAVVGTVKMDAAIIENGNQIAYQRFSMEKDTILALLPLDREYCSFVISAPKSFSHYLMNCDGDTFIEEINQVLSVDEQPSDEIHKNLDGIANTLVDFLQQVLPDSSHQNDNASLFDTPPRLESLVETSRASFPLLFGTTTPRMAQPEDRIALVGDSAHRVHPLAGQGLNLGIQDACELVKQIEARAAIGENIFDLEDTKSLSATLTRYEMKRQVSLVPMMGGILSMPYLFKLAPSRVLSTFNKLNPIKSSLVRFAKGF